jgi:ATP-dependent DNA helicase RecQ
VVATTSRTSYSHASTNADEPLGISLADARQLTSDQRWTWVAYLRSRGALTEAAEWLDLIESINGPSVKGQEERAALLIAAGREDEAVAILRQRAESRPSATASVRLALALLSAGDTAEASRIAAEVAASSPELKSVQALRLEVARANGDHQALIEHYRDEVAANGNSTAARLGLAQVALDQGETAEASRQFETALSLRAAGEGLALKQAAGIAAALGRDGLASELGAEFETRSQQSRRQRDRLVQTPILDRLRRPVPDVIPTPAPNPLPAEWPGERQNLAPHATRPGVAVASPIDEPDLEVAPVGAPVDLADQHPEVQALLRRAFGYADLRPGQAAVIANVLDHKDTIAIMPTGAGKSLTFQIPAMILPGVTLVLSPLIALMKDQVDTLPAEIRERTALVNSTLTPAEQRQTLEGIASGHYKLVYAAPERLRQWAFVHAMRQAGTSLVVIDEAHCISMWGHDFRPDYLQIPQVLPALGNPSVLAITATATRRMSGEIGQALGRELDLLTVNLFRPNLFFSAFECSNREDKIRRTLEICQKERGAGIIYVGSRADADKLATSLRQRGVSAVPYHAGLDQGTRARHQDMFMSGQARVVAATVAFGMGVNKSDVRFIVHLAPPRSLESYAQESGRAGRDGEPARCVLLYSAYDSGNLSRRSLRDQIPIPVLRRIYLNLRANATGRWAIVDPRDLLPSGSVDTDNNEIDSDVDPRVGLGVLAQAGLVRRHPDAPAAFTLQPYAGFSAEGTSASGIPWREYVRWSWDGSRLAGGSLDTLIACNALGITPTTLTETLDSEPDLGVREGNRIVCLELLPADATVKDRMADVLQRGQSEAVRRVGQMMEYAAGNRCRHQAIAAHLGQRLPACGTVCDVCTGAASGQRAERTASKRVWTTAHDALEVLEAVRSLPFPMGKTGLTRLLNGSIESSVRDDRSGQFGALKDVSPGKVGSLIDQLIGDGFLFRDLNHEYKLISVTGQGASADLAALRAAGHPDADSAAPRRSFRR